MIYCTLTKVFIISPWRAGVIVFRGAFFVCSPHDADRMRIRGLMQKLFDLCGAK